jgi:hypothetical protein
MIDMGFEADVNFILDSLPVSNLKPEIEEDLAGDAEENWIRHQELINNAGGKGIMYRQTVRKYTSCPFIL